MSSVIQEILLFFQRIHPLAAAALLAPISLLILFAIMQMQLQYDESKKNARQGTSYQSIERLADFDSRSTPPAALRPFKKIGPISQPSDFNSYIALDNAYHANLESRREQLRTHLDASLAASPASWDPVAEFHEWLTGIYLPHRYPSMFILMAPPTALKPEKGRGLMMRNKITNETVPVTAPNEPEKALAALGAHVDADFVFLVPNAKVGGHCVEAYVATDRNLEGKLGKAVGDVGVESMSEKLEAFFGSLPGRRMIVRESWALVAEDCVLHGDYIQPQVTEKQSSAERLAAAELEGMRLLSLALRTPHESGGKGKGSENSHLKDVRLRCERQTLHRLPETNGLVYSSKTYYYKPRDVVLEGHGAALDAAIDSAMGDHFSSAENNMGFHVKKLVQTPDLLRNSQ